MSNETFFMVVAMLFIFASVWLSIKWVNTKQDLDLEKMKHSATMRHLENSRNKTQSPHPRKPHDP